MSPLLKSAIAVVILSVSCAAAERPNIVLIYTDDVGYGDVSCNGQSTLLTPNIDGIASAGVRFTDAHCSAATCTPSRFALLTGQYAFRQKGTGIARGNANMIIQPGTTTLPSLLQTAGYRTGVVGKWHLGLGDGEVNWNEEIKPGPNQIGFDYHFLIPATGDRVPCVYVEQGRVVDLDPADPIRVSYGERIDSSPSGEEARDTLKQNWSHGHNQTIVNGISRIGWMTGGKKARWVDEDMADVIVHKARSFIADNAETPFFLFFSTHDIHVPRVPHSRFSGKSGLGYRGDAMLQLDWCVGEILSQLDQLKLSDNTLVIFTSDNGPVLDDGYVDQANELIGEHLPNGMLRGGKYSLFEGGTRVPFMARWPKHIKPASTSDALFGQIDLATSLATLVGAEVPKGACPDSRNSLDTLLGSTQVGRPHLIHEASQLALRVGPWKYIPKSQAREKLGPWITTSIGKSGALFDLSANLSESNELSSTESEQLTKMRSLHEKLMQHADQPEWIGQ
jgi:arylsulfatase A-like enzyme